MGLSPRTKTLSSPTEIHNSPPSLRRDNAYYPVCRTFVAEFGQLRNLGGLYDEAATVYGVCKEWQVW